MDYLLCELHNLSGSVKEERKNHMEAVKNFVDINALVARWCWKASGGEMEGEAFMGECIALKEGMAKMKENYVNLVLDRDHLLMKDDMYHSALNKEDEESKRLANKLEITSDLMKSTQRFLQELKLNICKLQRDLKVSPLLCFMEGNVLGLMEEPHVEENHDEGVDLRMFVKHMWLYKMTKRSY